jgi:hypothetical protein
MLVAQTVRHGIDDSGERRCAHYLNARHEQLNRTVPVLPVERESTGRIVSLGANRFGVLAPRAPKGRWRRPIAVVDSWEEGQNVLRDWRQARDNILEFLIELAKLVPRTVAKPKWGKSGVRARPSGKVGGR